MIHFLNIVSGPFPLSNHVHNFFWNPVLDLVVIFRNENEYYMCRPELKEILLLRKTTDKITNFCWGTLGKTYTLGFESGKVSIHDIENNGDTVISITLGAWKIISLQYLKHYSRRARVTQSKQLPHQEDDDDELSKYFSKKNLKNSLPVLYKIPTIDCIKEEKKVPKNILLSSRFKVSILVSTTPVMIYFHFGGYFQIASLPVKKHLDPEWKIWMTKINLRMNKMFVVAKSVVSVKEIEKSTQKINKISISRFDISDLGENQSQLMFVAKNYLHLRGLMDLLEAGVMNYKKVYEKNFYAQQYEPFLESFDESVFDIFGDDTEIELEKYFSNFMMNGRAPRLVIDFVRNKSTERYMCIILKTLQKIKHIQRIYLFKYVHTYIKHILFRLSEVKGCVMWEEEFGALGLDENDFIELLTTIKEFFKETHKSLKEVNLFYSQFRAFIQYLRIVHYYEIGSNEGGGRNRKLRLAPDHEIDKQRLFEFVTNYDKKIDFDAIDKFVKIIREQFHKAFNVVNDNISKNFELENQFILWQTPHVDRKSDEKQETEEEYSQIDESLKTNDIGLQIETQLCKSDHDIQYFGVGIFAENYLVVIRHDTLRDVWDYVVFSFEHKLKKFMFYRQRKLIILFEDKDDSELFHIAIFKFEHSSQKKETDEQKKSDDDEKEEEEMFVFRKFEPKNGSFQMTVLKDLESGEGKVYMIKRFHKFRTVEDDSIVDVTNFSLSDERGLGNVYYKDANRVMIYDFDDEETEDGDDDGDVNMETETATSSSDDYD